jgi:hypothetical protein
MSLEALVDRALIVAVTMGLNMGKGFRDQVGLNLRADRYSASWLWKSEETYSKVPEVYIRVSSSLLAVTILAIQSQEPSVVHHQIS